MSRIELIGSSFLSLDNQKVQIIKLKTVLDGHLRRHIEVFNVLLPRSRPRSVFPKPGKAYFVVSSDRIFSVSVSAEISVSV
jgi:hypothetical protein